MTYDCFTFFNELDLLEIRLNVLDAVVDRFVLVEATKTHSGKDKPLYFENNKQRFSRFAHKITHIVVDDYPPFETSWTYENHQRNGIMRGLDNLNPDDTIMISDLDEIPDPAMVEKHKKTPGVKLFEQKLYYYYLNYQSVSSLVWRLGTRMLSYREFLSLDDKHSPYNEFVLAAVNQGPTPTKVRFYAKAVCVRNAGWHFSYLGGVDAIIEKIQSSSHQENNRETYRDPEWIRQRIQSGKDVFGRSLRYFGVELDATFPQYIVSHQRNYPHLIFPVTEAYLKKTKWPRRRFLAYGLVYDWILFRVIPRSMFPFLSKLKRWLTS